MYVIYIYIYIYIHIYIKQLLEDIKMLQVNFIMIYIIHKMLVLLKIIRVLKQFFRKTIFSQNIMIKSSKLKEYKNIEENIIKYIKKLFRLKKI